MISICIIESIKFESRTEIQQPQPPATLPGTRHRLVHLTCHTHCLLVSPVLRHPVGNTVPSW